MGDYGREEHGVIGGFQAGVAGTYGGPALWTPANTTTALWLDGADSSSVTIVTGVSQWSDKSGNSRHATQSDTEKQPAYLLSGQNSKNILTFDGSDDGLNISYFTLSANATLFFVANPTKAAVYNGPVYQYNAVSINLDSVFGGTNRTWYDQFCSSGRVRIDIDGNLPNNTWNNASIKRTTTQLVARLNGSAFNTVNSPLEYSSARNITIGFSLVGPSYFGGMIGEILIIQSPSDDLVKTTEGYLAHKWGLTANLPSDHPYKSAAPTV